MTKQGIFCLERDWGGLTDRTSVRLGLDMLMTVRGGRLIHRNAATSAEFEHYLTQWSSSRYDSFPLWSVPDSSDAGSSCQLIDLSVA